MAKKSILSAFFEGGAMALYASAKKKDFDQQDEENDLTMQSKRESLKAQQYGNSAIGPNALEVPEDTPHSYAGNMVGMAVKKAGAEDKHQQVVKQGELVDAHKQRWEAMTAEGKAKIGLGLKRISIADFNAVTNRMNAITNQNRAGSGDDDKTNRFLDNLSQKNMNLAHMYLAQGDSASAKAALADAANAARMAMERAKKQDAGKLGGAPSDTTKAKPFMFDPNRVNDFLKVK